MELEDTQRSVGYVSGLHLKRKRERERDSRAALTIVPMILTHKGPTGS